MAMNSPEAQRPDPHVPAQDEALLREATTALQAVADDRWVEIAPRILERALMASRRSRPIRATAPSGPIQISEQVIVSYLQDALDGAVAGSAVAGISVQLAGRNSFDGVLIELLVQFGLPILPLADRVRAIAADVLTTLGVDSAQIFISTAHVHVTDVTTDDPYTSNPDAEP